VPPILLSLKGCREPKKVEKHWYKAYKESGACEGQKRRKNGHKKLEMKS